MTDKTIKLSKQYEEFYPKNYKRNNNSNKKEKENNSSNKNVNFKEYVPTKRILNQQIHPLERNKEVYVPKHKSKFSNEKSPKIKKEEVIEEEFEEDDYSGLAGDNHYKNFKQSKYRNKIRYSEDTNDFKSKWKTEMCHYWEMYGFCKYGDSCAFAHGTDELNKRKMSSNYKTKPCKQFFELGYCTYGVRCQFSHKLLKEYEQKNDEDKIEVSYIKILSDFNNSSNQISHEAVKRPRLMTFENITSCTLDEKEKNRLKLYEDILAVKKKGNEELEHVISEDTNDNDGNSENNGKLEINEKESIKDNKGNKDINDDEDNKENEKNKRERFISI